jgi:hypothetical protein
MGTTKIKGEAQVQELYLLADGSRIVSGDFTVGDGANDREIDIDAGVGKTAQLHLKKENEERWILRANATAEGGSNVGTNFDILRYDDDGVYISTPLSIRRNTGTIHLGEDLRIAGGLYVGATDVDPAPGTIESTGHILAGVGTGYVLFGVRGAAASNSDIAWYAGTDIAAILRRDTNDDIVWQRYNPPGTLQDTALTFDSSTGDIYSVPLTSYHGSSEIIGWTTTTELRIFYKKVGRTVHVTFRIQGESNSNECSFTLPYQRTGGAYHFENMCHIRNNGTHAFGLVRVLSTKVQFYRSASATSTDWTTQGTKSIWGQIWYETD